MIGLIISLPFIAAAEETSKTEKTSTDQITPVKTTDAKKSLSELKQNMKLEPQKDDKTSNNQTGLYHIVVTTEDQKSQSIWVEVDQGTQKYVTIKLDNGNSQDVLIQLEDKASPLRTFLKSYKGLSSLTLQPISF